VVVTTNLPFLDRGLHFAKAYPRQHAVLAARIPEDKVPGGMFLCIDQPTWSVRSFYDDSGPSWSSRVPAGSPVAAITWTPSVGWRILHESASMPARS
jgi:hypothetical protein